VEGTVQPGESSDISLSFRMLITDICLSENTPILLCDILDKYMVQGFSKLIVLETGSVLRYYVFIEVLLLIPEFWALVLCYLASSS